MSDLIGKFEVLNRSTGKFELASLLRPIGAQHTRDFETHWRPAFKHRLSTMLPSESYESAQLQDQHWEWPRKGQLIQDRLDFDSFVVVVGGVTQGLLIVNLAGKSRLPDQLGDDTPYIELVAVAPWNRKGFTATPQYKGIGRLLIAAVISLSAEQELGGRFGLHALPQSAEWYRSVVKMTELGPDPKHHGLTYFEATAAQAKAFVT